MEEIMTQEKTIKGKIELNDLYKEDSRNKEAETNKSKEVNISKIGFFYNTNRENNMDNFAYKAINLKFHSIDEIIDKGGYTILTWKIIFLASVFVFLEGFYLTYFNFILEAFQSYYDCSDLALQMISGLNYLGMGLGSLITGFFTRRISRIALIYISLSLMSLLHLCLCFIKEIYVFSVCRFFIAFFIGIVIILELNILTEYLPVKFRSFMINTVWLFWGIGAIYFLFLCKIYIPSLDYKKDQPERQQDFYGAILQLWIVLFLLIIFTFFFLNDSPRNLILTDELDKAKKILDYYTNGELTNEEFEQIKINLTTEGENQFYERSQGINEIFHPRIRVMTFLMMIIFFFISFGFFGLNTVLADILKILFTDEKSKQNVLKEKDPINSLIIIHLTGSIGSVIGGAVSEIKWFGRKRTEIVFFSCSIFFAVLSLFVLVELNVFIGISLSFFQSAINIHITYTEEIYPTKIRDYSTGVMLGTTRIGGFLSQFAYMNILKGFFLYPIYFYIMILLLIIVLLCFLPSDNRKALDSIIRVHTEREDTEKGE